MKLHQSQHFFLFILAFICSSCQAQQENDPNSINKVVLGITVHQIDESIWVIHQDAKKNYWFGSKNNGIYLFNNDSIINLTTEDGLVSNQIRGFQEDHLGQVYIETSGGISKFDGHQFTTLDPIISSQNQWKLKKNDLWFGYDAKDLYRYTNDTLYELKLPRKDLNKAFGMDVKGIPFEANNKNSPYAVFGIDQDTSGRVWIGTATAGAFMFDGEKILWFGEKELSTLPDGRVPGVRSMIQDKNGYYWLSNFRHKYQLIESDSSTTYRKIEAYQDGTSFFIEHLPYFMSSLNDKEGNTWAISYGGGAWKYDGNELKNIPIYDENTKALTISIYQDLTGVLWVATDNAGIFKFNGVTFEKFDPKKTRIKTSR